MDLFSTLVFICLLLLPAAHCQTETCFPEAHPIMWQHPGASVHFTTKTTYLRAREALQHDFNGTLPSPGASCTAVYFYYLGRHSIRYPTEKQMSAFSKTLPRLQHNLVASGTLVEKVAHGMRNWKVPVDWEQYLERVTPSGRLETEAVARIFYQHFPSLLSLDNTTFSVVHSKQIRTKETAEAFVHSLAKIQKHRELSSSEMDKLFPMVQNDTVTCAHCSFKAKKTEPSEEQMGHSAAAMAMLDQFNRRYNLTGQTAVNFSEIVLMHAICGHEVAIKQYSPWCELFSYGEMQLLELLLDIADYYKRYVTFTDVIAKPVFDDLYNRLNAVAHEQSQGHRAMLYFSHDGLLTRLVTYLGLYPALAKTANISTCQPLGRTHRSSTWVPFNTNLVVVMYRCEGGRFKLLPLWNEIPVQLRGCKAPAGELCDFEDYASAYKDARSLW